MVVALPLFAAIAALYACLLLLAIYFAWGYSFGPLLNLLAAGFRRLSIHLWFVGTVGFGFMGDMIDGVEHDVRAVLNKGISYTDKGFIYFMHYTAYLVERSAAIVEGLAGDTRQALETLRRITVPYLIKTSVDPLWHRIGRVEGDIAELGNRAAVAMEKPYTIVKHEITRVAAAAVAVPLPRIGVLERDTAALKARIKSIEEKLSLGTIAGIVGYALAQLGLGSLRCANTKRLAKGACGMDANLLESLLSDALAIFGTLSLVELAEELRPYAAELGKETARFWRVV